MSYLTLRTALDGLFADVDGQIDGVDTYFDFEPAPGQITKTGLTVSWVATDPTFWTFALRIYIDPRADAKKADDELLSMVAAAETALDAQWGPTSWSKEWRDDIQRWVATRLCVVGREDF